MMKREMTDLERRARRFAAYAHGGIGQLRKYTGEPYITHPAAVVELVRKVGGTPEMLAAAWLHDVVEDVASVSIQQIEFDFGPFVAELVYELTDRNTSGNRAQRKRAAAERLAKASTEAQTIKLADLINNSESIVKHDPKFAAVYLVEKDELLRVMTRGDHRLYNLAYATLLTGRALLALEAAA
jgi:guanosine-3',5'-bis(diphosphate) 3'-pyrophosphohydrolase